MKYYDHSKVCMDRENFNNLITLFIESWYLKASFSQKYGVIEESKHHFKDEVYALLKWTQANKELET